MAGEFRGQNTGEFKIIFCSHNFGERFLWASSSECAICHSQNIFQIYVIEYIPCMLQNIRIILQVLARISWNLFLEYYSLTYIPAIFRGIIFSVPEYQKLCRDWNIFHKFHSKKFIPQNVICNMHSKKYIPIMA